MYPLDAYIIVDSKMSDMFFFFTKNLVWFPPQVPLFRCWRNTCDKNNTLRIRWIPIITKIVSHGSVHYLCVYYTESRSSGVVIITFRSYGLLSDGACTKDPINDGNNIILDGIACRKKTGFTKLWKLTSEH